MIQIQMIQIQMIQILHELKQIKIRRIKNKILSLIFHR